MVTRGQASMFADADGSADSDVDEDVLNDPMLDADFPQPPPDSVRSQMRFIGIAGEFTARRQCRVRIPLGSLKGIVLLKSGVMDTDPQIEGSGDAELGCLVLELQHPIPATEFATLTVGGKSVSDPARSFKVAPDWTPGQAASKASRVYLVALLDDLHQLAAHMCQVSSHVLQLFQGCSSSGRPGKRRRVAGGSVVPFNSLATGERFALASSTDESKESSSAEALWPFRIRGSTEERDTELLKESMQQELARKMNSGGSSQALLAQMFAKAMAEGEGEYDEEEDEDEDGSDDDGSDDDGGSDDNGSGGDSEEDGQEDANGGDGDGDNDSEA